MDNLKGKKLGLLLSTPPKHPNAETVARLSHTAQETEVQVYLYLIDEGVKNIDNPIIRKLTSIGVKLNVCAYGCQQHNVSTDGHGPDVTFCGLVVLSQIVTGCDQFIAFN
jgi:sulfur relay (sulfurtransferase) complex TusBCD TusD component (DsrE family)